MAEQTDTKPTRRRRGRAPEPSRPTPPSVMEELLGRGPAAEPEPAAEEPAPEEPEAEEPEAAPEPAVEAAAPAKAAKATAPRKAAPRRASGRRGPASAPLPAALAEKRGATTPLQVKVPVETHWSFKVNTMLRGADMSRVVISLIDVWLREPELWQELLGRLAVEGPEARVAMTAALHDAMRAALEADLPAEEPEGLEDGEQA